MPDVELAPLTILVGENSAGKTSFLSLVKFVAELTQVQHRISFNRPPFNLGSFGDIAYDRGGRGGQENTFAVGFEAILSREGRRKAGAKAISVDLVLENTASQPTVRTVRYSSGSGSFEVSLAAGQASVTAKLDGENFAFQSEVEGTYREIEPQNFNFAGIAFLVRDLVMKRLASSPTEDTDRWLAVNSAMEPLTDYAMMETVSVYAASPTRTRPRRSYNPSSETPSDEAAALEHLAGLKRLKSKRWPVLRDIMVESGKTAGLFDDFDIRLLGRNDADPFQATVKVGGRKSNIIDVGYGVSQVLPLLYDLYVKSAQYTLVQQPETHLHPRAQTGIGALIATFPVRAPSRTLIVETHSDFIIDQVRLAVRRGSLKPSDCAIYFFSKEKRSVSLRRMVLDAKGAFANPIPEYREFFLRHQRDMLIR